MFTAFGRHYFPWEVPIAPLVPSGVRVFPLRFAIEYPPLFLGRMRASLANKFRPSDQIRSRFRYNDQRFRKRLAPQWSLARLWKGKLRLASDALELWDDSPNLGPAATVRDLAYSTVLLPSALGLLTAVGRANIP